MSSKQTADRSLSKIRHCLVDVILGDTNIESWVYRGPQIAFIRETVSRSGYTEAVRIFSDPKVFLIPRPYARAYQKTLFESFVSLIYLISTWRQSYLPKEALWSHILSFQILGLSWWMWRADLQPEAHHLHKVSIPNPTDTMLPRFYSKNCHLWCPGLRSFSRSQSPRDLNRLPATLETLPTNCGSPVLPIQVRNSLGRPSGNLALGNDVGFLGPSGLDHGISCAVGGLRWLAFFLSFDYTHMAFHSCFLNFLENLTFLSSPYAITLRWEKRLSSSNILVSTL